MARVLGLGLLAFLALGAFPTRARAANGTFCQGTLNYPEGAYVCVGSQAGAAYVSTVVALGPDADGMATSVASTGAVATSSYGAGTAQVTAKVGTLSGKTSAEVLTVMSPTELDPDWNAGGLATAAFRDTVLIQGRPGVPLGTPVIAHLRTKVVGAFSAVSPQGVPGGEADFDGQVWLVHAAGGQTELQVPLKGVFWSYQGHTGGDSDTLLPNVKTGDSLELRWALRIESFVKQTKTLPKTDSEIVAQLFIDLEPTIAIAVGQTAYSYRPDDGDSGEAGAGGAAGASGATGEAPGDAGGSAGAAQGGAGGDSTSPGEAGEAGVGGAVIPSSGGASAGHAQGGTAGSTSSSSNGCSISSVSNGRSQLPFALAMGGILLALVHRRRSSRHPS
ncbi:MAG TPA: hypothetical protein VHM25_06075 [Polyangiaceae bacterium]|nr:hypothetical protein [Polyangiaceae bacterium]